MKGKGEGEEVRRKGEKQVQGKGGEGPRIIYLYVHIFKVHKLFFNFNTLDALALVVKHQKCNYKAFKSTVESMQSNKQSNLMLY